MRRAQPIFPVSQIGNRSFVLFHRKHALRSWISLSFLRCTALSRVQSTKNVPSTLSQGLFTTLCFLAIITLEGLGCQYSSLIHSLQLHLPILCCASVVFRPAEESPLFSTLALHAMPCMQNCRKRTRPGRFCLKKSMAFCSIDHISKGSAKRYYKGRAC